MPDISTINGVDITTLSSFGGVAFDDGQTLDGQNVALISDAHELISSSGAISSSTSVSFGGSYSKYDIEEYHFINIRPSNSGASFSFQAKRTGTSTYNLPITSSHWAHWNGGGSSHGYSYFSSSDQGNGVNYQQLAFSVGNATDEGLSGILRIYGGYTSSNRVKHFQCEINNHNYNGWTWNHHAAGYINTIYSLSGTDFKFNSGSIASGEIRRYGILNS